ncbi:hypothetical protein A5844_000123, partial [Enterococcus sp. 10A9_DIV0425]
LKREIIKPIKSKIKKWRGSKYWKFNTLYKK